MKAIVVGAGILGASITYQLAKRGVDVTIVDKATPGDAASAASFAWLNSNNKKLRPYHDLNVMSIGEWNAIARELRTSGWLHTSGNIHVADTTTGANALLERVARLHSYGYPAIPLTTIEMTRYDPVIRSRPEYEFAAFFPSEGYITVPLLIHDLISASKSLGTEVLLETEVVEFSTRGDDVTGVVLAGGQTIKADVVVMAAGAGIGTLMSSRGVQVRTDGTPGVSITTSPGSSRLSTMLHLPRLSVRPDTDGRLVVRSKVADNQLDLNSWSLPDAAVLELLEQTAEHLTDLDAPSVRCERVQIAARPYPFDGLPVAGFWDGIPGLYVTTMHSGVTMGAIVSRLAAEEITLGIQSKLLEGFRPTKVLDAAKSGAQYFDPYALEGETAR